MKYCVIGKHGFIGSRLAAKLESQGHEVVSTPTKDCDTVFHFGSPTHIPFADNADFHIKETLDSFLFLFPFCRDYKIKLIYPSSALVYEPDKDIAFSRVKKILELLQGAYDTESLCVRIFPVYGETEKGRRNTTAIYKWCEQLSKGQQPVIYGDGFQIRDFIHLDDVVDTLIAMEKDATGIQDIGAGKPYSFVEIVDLINKELGTFLNPKFVPAPPGYAQGIMCKTPVPTKVSLEEGIKRICQTLKSQPA